MRSGDAPTPLPPGPGRPAPALSPGLALIFLFACDGCTAGPALVTADGAKVTTGGSFLTRKENHHARVSLPDGTVLETGATNSDETGAAAKIINAGTIRAGLNSLNKAVDAGTAIAR